MKAKSKRQNTETPAGSNGHAPVRAVLYARVSTEEQRERQSIQTQIDFAHPWCEREGIPLVGIYCDESISGTIRFEDRPDGKRLLEDARQKKFNVVLVYKVDRLGRADIVTHVARHHLETLGVGIRSLTEPFDTATPHGRFMFGIFASFAQLERDNIRERSSAGMDRVAKTGKWLVGIVPYGYRLKERFLEVNEDPIPGTNVSEAEVVRMIFQMAAEEKLGTVTIASRLSAMGIPPHHIDGHEHAVGGKRRAATAGKWYPARVSYLLHETIYRGLHTWGKRFKNSNKELVKRTGPAIVSAELWQKAQETLQRNFRFAKRNAKHDYLLRSLVKCGFCDRTLTGVTVAGKRYYYRCNATMRHFSKGPEPCPARHLPKDWLEGVVWNDVQNCILHQANLEEIITEGLQEQDRQRQELRATHTRLQADIKLKDEERERIITAYRKGWLSNGDLERQLTGIEKERRQLEQVASDLEKRYDLDLDLEAVIATTRQLLGNFRATLRKKGSLPYQEKREFVELFVKEVRVNLKKGSDLTTLTLKRTIPWRQTGENLPGEGEEGTSIKTISWRPNVKRLPEEEEEVPLWIIYRFPLPKAKDLVSIIHDTEFRL